MTTFKVSGLGKPLSVVRNRMKLLYIIVILLLFVSCSGRQDSDYFVILSDNSKLDTLPINLIRVDTFPSGAQTIVYYTKNDTIGFFVRKDTITASETTWGVEDQILPSFPARNNEIIPAAIHKNRKGLSPQLQLVKKDSTMLGSEKMEIFYYKQASQEEGDYFYCWSPKTGVFCRYATSKPEFAVLQSNDTFRNRKIGKLLQRINTMENEKLKAFIAAQR